MTIPASVYGELTQPFRHVDLIDPAVLAAFPLARAVEALTAFSTIAGLEKIAAERFSLLSTMHRRFLVTVEGADYIGPDDFAIQAPSAILRCTKWKLTGPAGGRRVVIVSFESDYSANVTRLLVWG